MSDNAANSSTDHHTAAGPRPATSAGRLNWLRAGVLGANDGIVSVAGMVVGVAGATPSRGPIFTAGLVAGAVSMALGAILPLLAILLPPPAWRIPTTFIGVLVALSVAGTISARIGGSSSPRRAVMRVVIGGTIGLGFTYGVGHLFGAAIG